MQLYCFTYAGGNAGFFDMLDPELSSEVELVKLEYAGHGTRRHEPFCRSFKELARDMYKQLIGQYRQGEPYALFGYSMGSIAAIETLSLIQERKELPAPSHVFLAAHEPKTKYELECFTDDETDERIKERTIQFGGIPERLMVNKSFWRVYLPVYRADYQLISGYDFDHLDFVSDIPATVFYSDDDTPYSDIKQWRRYFIDKCDLICFTGNHFFIREHTLEICKIIKRELGTGLSQKCFDREWT